MLKNKYNCLTFKQKCFPLDWVLWEIIQIEWLTWSEELCSWLFFFFHYSVVIGKHLCFKNKKGLYEDLFWAGLRLGMVILYFECFLLTLQWEGYPTLRSSKVTCFCSLLTLHHLTASGPNSCCEWWSSSIICHGTILKLSMGCQQSIFVGRNTRSFGILQLCTIAY